MFGHDMSWASFNVLEVMSSPKYLQKRVGYLSAVQSFRPDTEVLMLATNLLKKVHIPPLRNLRLNQYLGYNIGLNSYYSTASSYHTARHNPIFGNVRTG